MKPFKSTLIATFFLIFSSMAVASSAEQQLNQNANHAIAKFNQKVLGGQKFLSKAKGYIVFPKITKAGFILGGSYGEGVLRVNGQTKHYYSVTSGSIGFQAGAQQHSMIIAFLTDTSLRNFIYSNGWEAGVDGSIVVSDWGAGKDITTMSYEKPIVAFVFGGKGLMGGVSIKGYKFQKIVP